MADKYITSIHIEKLGHKILEIRERALFNIISKLDNGIVFDNDLARSKELLSRLFQWFLFEPCSSEDAALTLIKKILKSESGTTLINHYGKENIKKELIQIRSYIEPEYIAKTDELIRLVKEYQERIVPPLVSDKPLSYRSNQSCYNSKSSNPIFGTTATTMEGYIQRDKSMEQEAGVPKLSLRLDSCDNTDRGCDIYSINPDNLKSNTEYHFKSEFILTWQPLVERDNFVLQSVENSLRRPPQPSTLLHNIGFFDAVLIHDFPAEVFLQRPTIVYVFYDLISLCPSTRVVNGVLMCLNSLSKALKVRISQNDDPNLKNLKVQKLQNSIFESSSSNSNRSSCRASVSSKEGYKFESHEELQVMKNNQMSIPKYCSFTIISVFKFLCVKPESFRHNSCKQSNQVGINTSLCLLQETFKLFQSIIKYDFWEENITSKSSKEVMKELNEILVQFGDALDHFRLESLSSDTNLNCRVVYLYILHVCLTNLNRIIPLSKVNLVMPDNLKKSLAGALLDVTLARLYPKIHDILVEYVQSFSFNEDCDHLLKYKNIRRVCNGMKSSVKFLKDYKTLSFHENLNLAKEALPSVEFHKDVTFLKAFIEMCSEKLPLFSDNSKILKIAEDIIVCLLSHHVPEIREEIYKLCYKTVIKSVGPKMEISKNSAIGTDVLFLFSSKILSEIAMFGGTSENRKVQSYAEDILIHILKSKMLVCEIVWNKLVEALIPSLPVICSFAEKKTAFGRIIINMLDPDTASDLMLPSIVTLKCNALLLFGKDSASREEAFSRICWLLSSQDNAKNMLPRLNNMFDKALANICRTPRVYDVNKGKNTQHFYQPSSLYQVIEVLKSTTAEPVIRRSALTQVSVMMEDPLLHQVFLDLDGVTIVMDILKVALNERDFRDYPDSVIPIISIFKHLCLYHSNIRERMSNDLEVISCILRGIFLFFTEERVKQDGNILLFILILKDYILGSPSKCNFSIPNIVQEKFSVPFICNTLSNKSSYMVESLVDFVENDRWCLSSLQIQWNTEMFGFEKLLKMNKIDYSKANISDMLKIDEYDLNSLKKSSIQYCIEKYLKDIQNATVHSSIEESIQKITIYIHLYNIYHSESTENSEILKFNWESSLSRLLKVLPSSEDDVQLLKCLIQFSKLLVPLYRKAGAKCWITTLLKDPSQCILDLICVDTTVEEEIKFLSRDLLHLVEICAKQEQHYLDYYSKPDSNETWAHIIRSLADNLKFNDAQHFYNLAYLDSILSCLVNLTATLGWSNSKPGTMVKDPIPLLITVFCELIIAFHCGKGPAAAISLMGLSITRNVMFILNHLVAELQNLKAKGWEICFLDSGENESIFQSLVAIWESRDVLLRTAVIQLFKSLAHTPRIAIEIARVRVGRERIWELAFSVAMDHQEANIVRENAILLLANLANHTACNNDKITLISVVFPDKKEMETAQQILLLIKDYDFYHNLDIMLNSLFTLNCKEIFDNRSYNKKDKTNFCYDSYQSTKSWSTTCSNSSSDIEINITTPGLIKAVTLFLHNILVLTPDEICDSLQDLGLLKLLFRTICNPSISISNTKELSLYCDLLEMNTIVCCFLTKTANYSTGCLGVILHTKDCFNTLLSLLNPKIYHTHLPQLLYLRNRLWSEIFHLITTIVELGNENNSNIPSKSVEALDIFSNVLSEIGSEPFLESMCESISLSSYTDLQNSALGSLTSLLRIESFRVFEKSQTNISKSYSIQNILDTQSTSRTNLPSENVENNENLDPNINAKKEDYGINLIENVYFKNSIPKLTYRKETSRSGSSKSSTVAGEEICKILLYLYDICEFKQSKNTEKNNRIKSTIISSLSSLICVSEKAKTYALENNLLPNLIKKLKTIHVQLSLESVDNLRRVSDKKRISPVLKELQEITGLLTNFMYENEAVKCEAASQYLADVVHKLWIWFQVQNVLMVDAIKLLNTFTNNCSIACQTLPLTSPVAGSGPRKSAGTISLLHAIVTLISKEMDQISKTHDLTILDLSFNVLHNCCSLVECRIILTKSNLLQSVSRMHPALTKRQRPWASVELMWLEFLNTFTTHPEGQAAVAKIGDVMDIVLALCNGNKNEIKVAAMEVLRNLAFYQPNRPRLLSSGDFLKILQTKIINGSTKEKNLVVIIIWSLAANCQKAKLILKSAGLDEKLQYSLKHCQLLIDNDDAFQDEDIERMHYVLSILIDNDKK